MTEFVIGALGILVLIGIVVAGLALIPLTISLILNGIADIKSSLKRLNGNK